MSCEVSPNIDMITASRLSRRTLHTSPTPIAFALRGIYAVRTASLMIGIVKEEEEEDVGAQVVIKVDTEETPS